MDIEDVFNKWVGQNDLLNNRELRYGHSERHEIIGDLAVLLHSNNIPYEESKGLKRRLVNFLTTEEGRKGNGKHKGWKETVEEEFLVSLADIYIDGTVEQSTKIVSKEYTQIPEEIEMITKWAKYKFGSMWNESINEECCTRYSSLNMLFQQEVFYEDKTDFLD